MEKLTLRDDTRITEYVDAVTGEVITQRIHTCIELIDGKTDVEPDKTITVDWRELKRRLADESYSDAVA